VYDAEELVLSSQETSLCQTLPADFKEKLFAFQQHVIGLHKQKNSYLLSQILNASETPVYFHLPSICTVFDAGAKSVMIQTFSYLKMHVTVMLAVADVTIHDSMTNELRKLVVIGMDQKGTGAPEKRGCWSWMHLRDINARNKSCNYW
jgi:hypothetical protein